jgi:hypothetical protein
MTFPLETAFIIPIAVVSGCTLLLRGALQIVSPQLGSAKIVPTPERNMSRKNGALQT